MPGFGHRFHPVDPRRDPLLAWSSGRVADGVVAGRHLAAGLERRAALAAGRPARCR